MNFHDDFAPLATPGDAHREWHTNSGIPMGTPGCPQDACHLPDDPDMWTMDEDEPDMSKTSHWAYDVEPWHGLGATWEPDPYAGTGGYDDGIPF